MTAVGADGTVAWSCWRHCSWSRSSSAAAECRSVVVVAEFVGNLKVDLQVNTKLSSGVQTDLGTHLIVNWEDNVLAWGRRWRPTKSGGSTTELPGPTPSNLYYWHLQERSYHIVTTEESNPTLTVFVWIVWLLRRRGRTKITGPVLLWIGLWDLWTARRHTQERENFTTYSQINWSINTLMLQVLKALLSLNTQGVPKIYGSHLLLLYILFFSSV